MSKLPESQTTIHSLTAGPEAKEILNNLLERKQELEDMFVVIQPLLYTISVALYGEDNSEVSLAKLVQDAVDLINNRKGATIQ